MMSKKPAPTIPDLAMGGQAVIEGVMIRTGDIFAVAVRAKNKKIATKKEVIKSLLPKKSILRKPFLRGFPFLIDTLMVGFNALEFSAEKSQGEKQTMSKSELIITVLFSVVMVVGIFIGIPFVLAGFITKDKGILFHFIDGLLRGLIFLIYLLIISRFKDMRRIFEYHGAEHMAIATYEAKEKLTIKNVRKHQKEHPRCGTSFLLIVLIMSIIVHSFVIVDNKLILFASRIILIPIIAGISYELLKASAKLQKYAIFRPITWPGMWLQYITTQEPDDSQIEVAITAVNRVIGKDAKA